MTENNKNLSGKVAVITGGGSGLGRGIALALAEEGAHIVVCGRTEQSLVGTCDLLQAKGVQALPVVCDVSCAEDLQRLVDSAVQRFGTIDILVNNAALIPHGSLLEIDESVVQGAWETGPLAVLRLMRLCHPYLKNGGAIVNVSSGVSIADHAQNRGVYAASKSALNALSRAAANEWGGDGIRVNVIMPFARTEAVDRFFTHEPELANGILAQNPMRRVGDPQDDIGRTVAFLVGPAASYVNGVTLPIDGGASYVR